MGMADSDRLPRGEGQLDQLLQLPFDILLIRRVVNEKAPLHGPQTKGLSDLETNGLGSRPAVQKEKSSSL